MPGDPIEVDIAAEARRVEAEPKGLRWKSRAKIGDRTKWYDEPEEIAHQSRG